LCVVGSVPFVVPKLQVKLTVILIILVLYGFSIAYLFAPGTFDSTHVVEFIAGLPEGIKYAGKAVLAAPFAFHSLNGLRHLSWDMAKCQSITFP
jgi:succinate dehydrogenase (ubiquinone) cytochrome b560 subunit